MRKYNVFDNDFVVVGFVEAANVEQALQVAKRKYRFVAAPMVEEQPAARTPDPRTAHRAHAVLVKH